MVMADNMVYTNRMLDRWLKQSIRGDRDALENLYEAAAPAVYAYALSILQNHHSAEDVLQDCFMTLQSTGSSYTSQGKPMAFLMTITRNLCMKQFREQRRTVPLEEGYHYGLVSPNPEDRILIENCLKVLSEEERQIVILRVTACLKFHEIGKHMGLNPATVRTKYRRALQALRDAL